MAGATQIGFLAAQATSVSAKAGRRLQRRRRVSPQAGRALEILGHAVGYLTDEFVYAGGSFSPDNEQLRAIQLLMALNRQIYLECPEVPSLGNRILALFHLDDA